MRGWLLGLVAFSVGCASENGLYHGQKRDRPVEEEPEEPPVEGSATLKGKVCAFDGDSAVTHAKITVHHDAGPGWSKSSETETDAEGKFILKDLPPGTWPVLIQKGSFEKYLEVKLKADKVTDLTVDECVPLEQGETKIAVVTGQYDDIGALIDQLELEYDRINGRTGTAYVDFLRDPDQLAQYDIIFFNCGMGEAWTQHKEEVTDNLKQYVRNGGSIYASDWAYWLVESTWPGQNDFLGNDLPINTLAGAAQQIEADVLDPAMVAALGSNTANLNYDLPGWAAMTGSDAEVLIRAQFRVQGAGMQTGPLATRIHDGEGMALFTTFHNEQQTTNDMLVLLDEIILSL